ncbi:MAG: fatty acid CoA ligase family protein [Planctomycetota bacterium]
MSLTNDQQSVISGQPRVNVADRLTGVTRQMPDAVAVAAPGRGDVAGKNTYSTCSFAELDRDATALARGLVEMGVLPGTRLVLMVRPGTEFVKLVFALLRSGATTVLIDPGMGRKHLVNCLASVEPEGFVAISPAHAVRTVLRYRFSKAKFNITVGRRWFWRGKTYGQLLRLGQQSSIDLPLTLADDAAAIIYTSGSTGPPKGVLYTHQMFDTQAAEIAGHYDLQPGGFDLACFPLFGLFNSAMGVTTVFPDMDFSRPASADPQKLLAAAHDWQVTQAFASPAVWDKLSLHCQRTGEMIPTLRKVFSCGAPVPAKVLKRTLDCVSADAEMHTPYGATESLPIATIEAAEVLGETAEKTDQGGGVCVGRRFDTVDWRVIRITDEPIANIDETEQLPTGEIGELIVRGPQVSPEYFVGNSPSATGSADSHNALAKIRDGERSWHRMGDVGYLDEQGRFWYCGRKAQRVVTKDGTLFTIPIEAQVNAMQSVRRSALVGIGNSPSQRPQIIVEIGYSWDEALDLMEDVLGHPNLEQASASVIQQFVESSDALHDFGPVLFHPSLPVDVRHNSKINREQLAEWATKRLKSDSPPATRH